MILANSPLLVTNAALGVREFVGNYWALPKMETPQIQRRCGVGFKTFRFYAEALDRQKRKNGAACAAVKLWQIITAAR